MNIWFTYFISGITDLIKLLKREPRAEETPFLFELKIEKSPVTSKVRGKEHYYFLNLSYDNVLKIPSYDRGGSMCPPPFLFVKTMEKIIRFCTVLNLYSTFYILNFQNFFAW